MKIRFRFTARDLAIAVVRTVDCGIWPRSTRTVQVLVAVLVALVMTTLYFGWREGRLGALLVELTLPIALFFLVFAFLIRHLRRVILKSAMAQKETTQFLGDHEAEILEDGLWHKTPVAEALHPWKSLVLVERRGDYAFVWMEKNSLVFSLNRNSMTEGDFDRFVETLERKVPGKKGRGTVPTSPVDREWSKVVGRLCNGSKPEILCPSCGKGTLRIADAPRVGGPEMERHVSCPECGAYRSLLLPREEMIL